jgi:ethanolamine ammonia-lyase small subunit
MESKSIVTTDAWQTLRSATSARIALGRAGGSLPTVEWLDFKSAYASARQAVHAVFDARRLADEISSVDQQVEIVDSDAHDRATYLQRPDLGRRLNPRSEERLRTIATNLHAPDMAIVVSDGLSAVAAHRQAPPLLACLLPRLRSERWELAPVVIARFGRVALQDQIGQLLGAPLALTLIGERPGLGSPDSLGAYIVHAPHIGNTDAKRNCVSNIRPEGLACDVAADTIHYLLTEARRRRLSGVQLKDERPAGSPVKSVTKENRIDETS